MSEWCLIGHRRSRLVITLAQTMASRHARPFQMRWLCCGSFIMHIASCTCAMHNAQCACTCACTCAYAGFLKNMDASVDEFAKRVKSDPKLAGGFNAFGLSQGNNLIRGYIAKYNDPPAVTFLSICGINAGVGAFPECSPGIPVVGGVCKALTEVLGALAYNPLVQGILFQVWWGILSQGGWGDPLAGAPPPQPNVCLRRSRMPTRLEEDPGALHRARIRFHLGSRFIGPACPVPRPTTFVTRPASLTKRTSNTPSSQSGTERVSIPLVSASPWCQHSPRLDTRRARHPNKAQDRGPRQRPI